MPDREKVIKGLETCSGYEPTCDNCPYFHNSARCLNLLHDDAITLLKDQGAEIEQLNRFVNGFSRDAMPVVRCKDCKNWIPGYITDKDDFIPPKCGKYQQMVGHSSDDFCNLAERQEGSGGEKC